jgi:hypothetical protein
MASGKTKNEMGGGWNWLGSCLMAGSGISGNVGLGFFDQRVSQYPHLRVD